MEHTIIIYTTPTCHFCHMAKDFFKEKGLAYTEYDVTADAAKRQEMITKTGQLGVHVIMIDGEAVVGFNKATVIAKLGIAA